jgi:hypothetical protein
MMKRLNLLALCSVVLLCGCNTISYKQSTVGPDGLTNNITFSVNRWFWSTENYEAVMNPTGGGTLKATKSNVDAAAIKAVADGVIDGMMKMKP